MKKMLELTIEDLKLYPAWSFEGKNDIASTVSPITTSGKIDLECYIALTRFILADGTEHWGYCSPADPGIDYSQPVIILPDGLIRFYADMPLIETSIEEIYKLLERTREQIFPIKLECMVDYEGQFLKGELREDEWDGKNIVNIFDCNYY